MKMFILGIIRRNDVLDGRVLLVLLLTLLFGLLLFLYFALDKRIRWRQRSNIRTAARVQAKVQNLPAPAAISYLRKIDPFVFEELILTAFEQRGNRVIRNTRYTGDGGVDGRIIENGQVVLIQAKRYKSYVSKRHIESFMLLIREVRVNKGYFIHTGKTGVSTIEEFSGEELIIISGQKLFDLLKCR